MESMGLIIVGCLAIIFRKFCARRIIEGQEIVFFFELGEKEIRRTELLITILGIVSILFGLMKIILF